MTTYKRLGDYIREVNVRNRELKVTKLVGLKTHRDGSSDPQTLTLQDSRQTMTNEIGIKC